jgi:hypothetical protein
MTVIETIFDCEFCEPSALHDVMFLAIPGNFIGISTNSAQVTIRVFSLIALSPQETLDAEIAIDTHDPVFLSANKRQITADGLDTAMITVTAPKPGAAPVTLDINGQQVPITLIDGIGSQEITAIDPMVINVSVVNPENRISETIIIEAV